jgi:hypothetical protein
LKGGCGDGAGGGGRANGNLLRDWKITQPDPQACLTSFPSFLTSYFSLASVFTLASLQLLPSDSVPTINVCGPDSVGVTPASTKQPSEVQQPNQEHYNTTPQYCELLQRTK